MGKEKIDKKLIREIEITLLVAIIALMAFTPIGYFKTAGVEITLITIPVIVGSVLLGRRVGAILGLVFGATSFIQAFSGLSAFGLACFTINPLLCFLMCVPTRVLMGYLTGLIFEKAKDKSINNILAGLVGSLLNTVLFVSVFMLSYWNSEYVTVLKEYFGTTGVFTFIIAFVGINGLIEAVVNTIISGTLITALSKLNIE